STTPSTFNAISSHVPLGRDGGAHRRRAAVSVACRRIRTRQSDDASASCSGSSQLDPPSASSACTVRSTTPSAFNATSSPDPPSAYSEPKRLQSGKAPPQRHDSWRDAGLKACLCRDKADRLVLGLVGEGALSKLGTTAR